MYYIMYYIILCIILCIMYYYYIILCIILLYYVCIIFRSTVKHVHFYVIPDRLKPIIGVNDALALGLTLFHCPIYNDWQGNSHIDSVLNNHVNGTGNGMSVGTGTGTGNGNGTGNETDTCREAVMV